MSPEIPHPDLNKDNKPWQRLIKCGPGDNEEIKKAGEEARKIGPEVIDEMIVKVGKDDGTDTKT